MNNNAKMTHFVEFHIQKKTILTHKINLELFSFLRFF